jgi:hypothetical protein
MQFPKLNREAIYFTTMSAKNTKFDQSFLSLKMMQNRGIFG